MTDRIEVDMIVEALTKGFDNIVTDLNKVKSSANQVDDSMDKASVGAKRFDDSLDKVSKSGKTTSMRLTELKSGIDLTVGALRQGVEVAKAFYGGLKEGADLELAAQRADRLSAAFGTTADRMRHDLREATGGMVRDSELMANASDIMRLKLADTAEQVVELAEVSTKLGWDMQQVVLTFANNSKARLDALGLSVEDVTAKTKEFVKQGYSMDKAFDMAVLQAGKEQIILMGDAADTTAGRLARFEASVGNVFDRMKVAAAVKLGPAINNLADFMDDLEGKQNNLNDAVRLGIITTDEYAKINNGLVLGLEKMERQYVLIKRQVELLRPELEQQLLLEAALADAAQNLVDTGEDVVAHGEAIEKQRERERHGLIRLEEEERAAADAASGGAEAYEDYKEKIIARGEALAAMRQQLILTREEEQKAIAQRGDWFTQALQAGEDAYISWTTAVTYSGGLLEDQRDTLDELQTAYDRHKDKVNSLKNGVSGLGLTTDELNEALQKEYDAMALIEARMNPLLSVTKEVTGAWSGWVINSEALKDGLYEAADASGASALQLARMAVVAGESEQDVIAAFLGMKIEAERLRLGEEIAKGLDPELAATQLQNFAERISQQDFRAILGFDIPEEEQAKASSKIKGIVSKGIPEEDRKVKIEADIDAAWETIVGLGDSTVDLLADPYTAQIDADITQAESEVMRLLTDTLYPFEADEYIALLDADNEGVRSGTAEAQRMIDDVKGKTVYIDIITRHHDEYDSSGAGSSSSGGGIDSGAAIGLSSFTVPYGYPDDSYRLGLTSGEVVTVQTPAQQAQQAQQGGGATQYIFNNYTREATALAFAQVDMMRKSGLNAYMGVE